MKRLLIVGLVILALLYLIALGVGVPRNAQMSINLATIKNSWVSMLGRWLASSGPRLNLTGLVCSPKTPGATTARPQPADGPISLTAANPSCAIAFRPVGSDERAYRKTSVRIEGRASLYIFSSFDEKQFPKTGRDPQCFLNKPPAGFKLKVIYTPNAKQKGKLWSCWLRKGPDETADIVVMRDGGELTLTCEGCCASCNAGRPRVLRLRLE